MIKCDHWARVDVGLDGTPLIILNINAFKNTKKNQINT